MSTTKDKFQFAIDRGGTFTDVFARCPGGNIRVLKLLSEDPQHYNDAPTEGIRRILQEVRWNSIGGNLLKESELMRKIEISQIKKQIEVLTTFLPDLILKLPKQDFDKVHHFVGVLLFADVSGFTPLCEKYNKTGKGGIYRLTATLNAYIGAIVEVIYFCGGDVLKFSGDAFLALWKSEPDERLYRVIHEVIVCALFIQQTLGHFETEVNVLLKVKLAISCGNMTFSVIGDNDNKHYILLGPAINDVKAAEHASVSGDVVVAPTAWGHVAEESYDVTYTESGNVKVWRCLYKPNERAKKEEYDAKFITVQQLCAKHIQHRETLRVKKMTPDNVIHSKITERFVRSLPQRGALQIATKKWYTKDMSPFIIKPVQEQIEEKQPLEYLTEMREVTIQFINIVPTTYVESHLVIMLNNAYQVVCGIVCKLLGVVNKVSLFDKDAMMLVLFGLRGIKHEIESQNALISAYKIRKAISTLDGVKSVSVGVTNGLVYCGVVGHPLRREYTVIGGSVNKAARLMCAFEHKVTCDFKTYKNSKLSSYYFQMQPTIKLKGIEDAGHIFEYNEDFESIFHCEKSDLPLIGRKADLKHIFDIIHHADKVEYKGICYYGKQKVGQTRLLHAAYTKCLDKGYPVAAVQLCGGSVRPYFCVSHLYKQLYDAKAKVNASKEDSATVKRLPADLWNYNDILQQRSSEALLSKKQKIINLFKAICSSTSKGVTVLFIDNIQYIDNSSIEVVIAALNEPFVRLFTAGHFEEDRWKTRWELSRSNCVKLEELSPMRPEEIPSLVCQLLRVRGVPKKLVSLLMRTCEGCPGWIQICLLRLVNNGCLEIKFINFDDIDHEKFIFPSPDLLSNKYIDQDVIDTSKKEKTLLSVVELLDKFRDQTEELTLAAISLDLFDSFTPYQQLVIKTGAVLGDIFSRSLLIVMLKYPNEQVFANTIRILYEEEVFDCGTKYISSGGQMANNLKCYCYMQEEEIMSDRRRSRDSTKYAFCKLFHFKNKSLRSVAYELLPANQRKELHLRITNILENQNNMCPNCLRDDSVAIIKMKTFKQVVQFCNNKSLSNDDSAYFDYEIEHDYEVDVKDIIRKEIHKENTTTDNDKSIEVSTNKKFYRKVWDPTTCFCLEILTKVYADLIFHSDKAAQLGKKIFYLTQYGAILMTMNEYRDAIPILTEASELCMTDAKCKNAFINEEFRRVHIGKIHFLLAEVNFRLGDIGTAKVHIVISLRQYNVPIISLKYKLPHLLLKRPALLAKIRKSRITLDSSPHSLMCSDFGHCLNLLSNIFAAEGRWSLARMASRRSLYLLTISNPNLSILCDSYTTAIELYNLCGDMHTCEILDRCVSRNILKSFSGNLVIELYSICKLITVVFLTRMTHGHLTKSIKIGCRAMELNMVIQASYVQLEVIPALASALLFTHRIENAVYVIRILYNIGQNLEEYAYLDYFAFCVELNIETSFILEPIEACEKFAEKHFERQAERVSFTDSENKLIILLHLYHLRNNHWSEALKWKNLIHMDKCETNTISAIFNLMKYVESLLITLVWNIASKKTFLDLEEKRLKVFLKQIYIAAKRWKVCYPRYLHYMAYYNQIMLKKKVSKKLLGKALKHAKSQENVLEACWITQSKNTWNGGLNFGNDAKCIDWRLSHTYTEEQWSQILYALPCSIYS